MYTILENARIVISLLKQHNIRHIVLSPGGSNIPITQGVQEDPFFICHSVVDERSAIYFAIGLYQQTGEIIACSCTSAQATRNYIPGLTEAYYKHAPILALTMSKHPKFLGQDYMQCPIQTSLPIDAVKGSYTLPRINDNNDRELVIRTANEALLELTHHGSGPVQLNIEELDSETWVLDRNIKQLDEVRCIHRYHYWDNIDASELNNKSILIVIGDHREFTPAEQLCIERFCHTHNAVIYTNLVSNYYGKYAINGNLAVQSSTQQYFNQNLLPDIVISIGALTGDYGIYSRLNSAPKDSFQHWRVSLDGNVVDTYGKLTRVYEMREEDFFTRNSNDDTENNHSYYTKWLSLIQTLNYDVQLPLSNLFAATLLSKTIPQGSTLVLAIHNSLRVWNFMQMNHRVHSLSPVNAFGIDGATSMTIGASCATEELCFLITGDLAYLYDINALSIREKRNNIRILLCNNNGGFEFKGGNLNDYVDVGKYIAADNHFINSQGWAETNGFLYKKVTDPTQLEQELPLFTSPSDQPIILEIFTSPANEKEAYDNLIRANWHGTPDETTKREIISGASIIIKTVAGKTVLKKIKQIIHK